MANRISKKDYYYYYYLEGSVLMSLKGSKTEKNLWEAFAGESQARNKYDYWAKSG